MPTEPAQPLAVQETPAKPRSKGEALAAIQATETGIQLRSMEDMFRFAACVVSSQLAPKSFSTPEQVIVAVQFGMELGLSPMQALQNVAVINAKVGVYGSATLAIIQRDPTYKDHDEWFEVDDVRIKDSQFNEALAQKKNIVAVCEMQAKNRLPVKRVFSIADAKTASLWGKPGPWTQYPQRMLRYKARHMAENDCFPNALKGIPILEDLQAGEYQQPKLAKVREVATDLQLPDEPAPNEPATDGTDPNDYSKGEELFK